MANVEEKHVCAKFTGETAKEHFIIMKILPLECQQHQCQFKLPVLFTSSHKT